MRRLKNNTRGSLTLFIMLIVLGALVALFLVYKDQIDTQKYIREIFVRTIQVGECVPTFEVKHIEGKITDSELAASSCYDKLNVDDCLEVDIYSAEKQSFLKTDGIIDCRWEKK